MKNFKFKVNIIEHERGWGSKIDEVEEYSTYNKAVKRIKEVNSKNVLKSAPDYYITAEPANFEIE